MAGERPEPFEDDPQCFVRDVVRDHRLAHVAQPLARGQLVDHEREVPPPEARVAVPVGVERFAAEPLHKEELELLLARFEVFRVDGAHVRVCLDELVERLDDARDAVTPAHSFDQGGSHVSSMKGPTAKRETRSAIGRPYNGASMADLPSLHVAAITAALARLDLAPSAPMAPVAHSVLNHNYRVETARGPLFARISRASHGRDCVELEQHAMAWAAERGVPVVLPLTTGDGATLWEHEAGVVSIAPWVDGRHFARGAIDATGARTLGAMHGRTHAALASFRDPLLAVSGQVRWDTATTIATLHAVAERIPHHPLPPGECERLLSQVAQQLALVESGEARPPADFADLAMQPVHGDYQERNVMVDATGHVVAVVDWEMVALIPPVYEILRAVSFMALLAPPLLRAYLAGYRDHARLDVAACHLGPEMFWQHDLHSAWSLKTVFLDGDERAAIFLRPGEYRLGFRDPAFRAFVAAELRAAC